MSKKEKKITKKWLSNLLNEGQVDITFSKLDGTRRLIHATKVDPVESGDEDHITVWDGEKQDWRTIIIPHIEEVTYEYK